MPELIASGPDIPHSLLNDLDDGRVVFFCGAGVSMGPGSDLPSFGCLARLVYRTSRIDPDSVERDALCRREYDKVFGLLERPERLGSHRVRRAVIEVLAKAPTGPLAIHEALLKLSQLAEGVRLVTTNFDNRFVEAGINQSRVDAAPKFPVPKLHNWSSVVHLHGKIPKQDEESAGTLVLTAADFGRAYLTERWASRFVTELFREFTVVFVGYSLDDRVMTYLVDALAAEIARGAGYREAYAFAPYSGSACSWKKTERTWRAKNVKPILYDQRDRHRLLSETLIVLAEIKTDPFHSRERIVFEGMRLLPDGPHAERVAWALQDPTTAEKLADAPPLDDTADYPKLEQWLHALDRAGLFECQASRSSESSVRLVHYTQVPGTPTAVARHLACWIARHVHVPQMLTWILTKGGCLHPFLRTQIRSNLASSTVEVPARLRLFWSILASEAPVDQHRFLFTPTHLSVASDPERRRIADQVIDSIAPRLAVRAGQSLRMTLPSTSLSPIDSSAHLELLVGDDGERELLKSVLKDNAVLSRYAYRLTDYLELALSLLKEIGSADSTLRIRRSIAQHNQNRRCDDWGYLVDLVRDSYFAMAASSRANAKNLLDRWMLSDHPLFKRLALHALTDDANSDIRRAKRLLLAGRQPGLWDPEMRREVLRFLKLAGQRLPKRLLDDVVRAIHVGPS